VDESNLLNPSLAPDGRRIAVARTLQANTDIWLLDSSRPDVAERFTFDPAFDNIPIWSPDGTRVLFRSNRNGGPFDLYVKQANGGPEQALLANTQNSKVATDWSGDGRIVLYEAVGENTGWDIWALPLTGPDRKPYAIVQTPFDERDGQLSPDGRWVAYDSNESGRFEIYAQLFPGPGGKVVISTGGGSAPRWRRDGHELFYLAPDGAIVAVPLHASADGRALEPGAPVPLFRQPIVTGGFLPEGNRQQYTVTPDGQRFLVDVATGDGSASLITLVLNWKTALAARESR
jgi:Tol biopolymer transport system component